MPFTSDFPSTAELQRVKAEDDFFKLYNSDSLDPDGSTDRGKFRLKEFFENDTKKAKILDIALNLAPLIVDAGTDFLFGEPVRIEVDDGSEGADKIAETVNEIIERNDLHTKLEESCALFQSIGHAQFKIYADNGKAVIEEIPYDYWYPNWAGVPLGQESKDVRIVTYLTDVDASGAEHKYIYIENYYMVGKEAVVAKSLWEDIGGKIGQQVDLKKLNIVSTGKADEKKPLTMIESTGLNRLPIVPFHVRKTTKERYGQSVLKKVRPLLYEVNDRLTQVSIQFLKHLNAKLQLPETAVVRDPKTGKIQKIDLEVVLAKAGDPESKYITNDNPLVEQAFVHLEKVIRKIAKLTQTPDSFLTEDDKGGVEKAEALKTRLMAFLKRVRRYQRKYETAIIQVLRIALAIEKVGEPDKIPFVITFDTGLPKDWETDGQVWGKARSDGLASKETAIAMFQGIEGDELDEEIKRIDAEEEKLMMSALGDEPPPQA